MEVDEWMDGWLDGWEGEGEEGRRRRRGINGSLDRREGDLNAAAAAAG